MAKVIKPEQLAGALRSEATGALTAIRRGARLAAHRGRAHLVEETDRKGITDRGQYRNSFRVLDGDGAKTLALLINDAPYAGIIEMGARPHTVSKEGMELITAWAQRKFGMTLSEAKGVAYAVRLKLEREGQKPRHVVGDSLGDLTRFLQEEVEAQLLKRSKGKS